MEKQKKLCKLKNKNKAEKASNNILFQLYEHKYQW